MREKLSALLEGTLLGFLPALTALSLLVWQSGGKARLSAAVILFVFAAALSLSRRLHPVAAPLCLLALGALLAALVAGPAALFAALRTIVSGGVASSAGADAARLLCAGAAGTLCLLLLPRFALRCAASLLFAAFWIAAAFLYPTAPKLAFAAAAPVLLYTLCGAVARALGVGEETLRASSARVLLLSCLSLLLLAAPSSEKPYPYPLLHAVVDRIEDLFERVETRLVYRRAGDTEFGMRFEGYSEDAFPEEEALSNEAKVIYLQPGPDTGGVMYLAGSSFDSFDGERWISTVDRELVDVLGWNADTAEHLYALWRYRQNGGEAYLGENSLYLHYRNMDMRTLFTAPDTYYIRTNTDRYPFRSQPSKVLFDYQQDREAWYRLFLLHLYPAAAEAVRGAAEGYVYDAHDTLQWNTVLQDFSDAYGLELDRAAKAESFLARRASFIRSHYLSLPEVSEALRALAGEITASCRTDSEKLDAIAAYLQAHYSYTRSPDPVPAGQSLLDHLLFDSREGYCTWYATAATVLARLSGVPARYVQGYRVEVEKGMPTMITASDSHAWCEGYLEGYGWVTVDATPGFFTSLPEQDAAEAEPEPLPEENAPTAVLPGGEAQEMPETAAPSAAAKASPAWLLSAAAVCLALLAALAVFLLRRKRRARARYAAADYSARAEADLRTLLEYLDRRGYPRSENESLRRFFEGVRWHYLLDDSDLPREMLRLYEDVLFGGRALTEAEWLRERQFVLSLRPRHKK